ncbi:MAG TPA: DUF4124 domain-containing protein [Gammaproteobacteria bacterium]|nr:DUF4124 domain-containing protein [Gammaproteobacteria bacterium]
MVHKTFFTLILLLVSFSAFAEIYKWVDEQGKTHYGDKPAENAQQMDVDIEAKGHINTGQRREDKRKKLIDAYAEDRAREAEEKKKKKEKRAKNQHKCTVAKDRLGRYERARYLYDFDSNGSRIVVPDTVREKSTEALRQQVKKYCK